MMMIKYSSPNLQGPNLNKIVPGNGVFNARRASAAVLEQKMHQSEIDEACLSSFFYHLDEMTCPLFSLFFLNHYPLLVKIPK